MDLRSVLLHPRRTRALAAACVTLAAGGLVLARAPQRGGSHTAPTFGSLLGAVSQPASGAGPHATLEGPSLHGTLSLSQGAVAAGAGRTVLAELRLNAERSSMQQGAALPVAMSVVLDISGSMTGEKIEQARTAVLALVDQMRPDDRIALVTYSDHARVVQPLARVADVRALMHVSVPAINVEGGTNIPEGLAMGVNTLAEAPSGSVRRVVLLSDGNDTSGRAVEGIAAEVRTRADAGITLSALGIGSDYSESYMTRMADAGRGNYEFLRDGSQVASFLARELTQGINTTVQNAVAQAHYPTNWRLVRAYGAEVTSPVPGTLTLPVGALFGGDERRVVLEFAVDSATPNTSAGALGLSLSYNAVGQQSPVNLVAAPLALRTVADETAAVATRDNAVFPSAQSVVVAAQQQRAVEAWRQGNRAEAERISASNAAALGALQAVAAPAAAPALAAQVAEYARERAAFGSLSGSSAEGRAFGLSANARHRAVQNSASSLY